jgi:hypothetical protein
MHPFIFLATYWNPGIAKFWPIVKDLAQNLVNLANKFSH